MSLLLVLLCLPLAVWSLSCLLGVRDDASLVTGLLRLVLATLVWLTALAVLGQPLLQPMLMAWSLVIGAHTAHWLALRASIRLG